jgi:RNA ligase
MIFQPFGKIPRYSRECVITEKLDGTNAVIGIETYAPETEQPGDIIVGDLRLWAGSRNRWLTQSSDNFNFWKWVNDNREQLAFLGPGRHFGEWWGAGIQRGYNGHPKTFSLFNAGRWTAAVLPACCSVVPVIDKGLMSCELINRSIELLRTHGSLACPGYMKPEGIVIYHSRSQQLYKKLLENDHEAKGE